MTSEETLGMAAALLRDRAHTLRVRSSQTNVRERNALRDRAAKLERAALLLTEEAAKPDSDYQLTEEDGRA